MINHSVRVFLGHPIDDPTERRFLERLREDLATLDVPCLILANFFAGIGSQRQVDFLVVLPWRNVLIELKGYQLPVIAGINGPWSQVRPDGSLRPLNVNGYSEARSATFAVSDHIKALVERGELPNECRTPDPKRCFETTVCMFVEVPPGSRIDRVEHVGLVGYQELTTRLAKKGRRLPWTERHWEELVRCLGLYAEDSRNDAERLREAKETVIEDYRRRFGAAHQAKLSPRVATGVVVDNVVSAATDVEALLDLARVERTGVVLGASGMGKTHLADHAAIRLTQDGTVVVWLRAGEYQAGTFATQMARSMAPFSTEPANDLLRLAYETGSGVVVVLDGLNECTTADRTVLLEELAAFRLRWPAGVIITSQFMPSLGEPFLASEVQLQAPTAEARVAMFRAHGGSADSAESVHAFRTPFEVTLAAGVSVDAVQPLTITGLVDQYITRLAGSRQVRAVLEVVALAMDDKVRGALSMTEVERAIRDQRGAPPRAEAVDAALSSPLIAVRQGQVMFRHELLARCLVAGALVAKSTDGVDLANYLRSAQHADLRRLCVELDGDPERIRQCLVALADDDVILSVIRGECGAAAEGTARAEISALLHEATFETSPDSVTVEVVGDLQDRWHAGHVWTAGERAFLAAAGRSLRDGKFVLEVAALLERTDLALVAHVAALKEAGEAAPYSRIVRSTYEPWGQHDEDLPAGCLVVRACGHVHGQYSGVPGSSKNITDGVDSSSMGRLIVGMALISLDDEGDRAFVPDLLGRVWRCPAGLLKLDALALARRAALYLREDEPARSAVVAFLQGIEPPQDLFLSTTLVEALAAYGLIDAGIDLDAVTAQLRAILTEPVDSLTACTAAADAVAKVFEEDSIVGPYAEAIDHLHRAERTRLLTMAARASNGKFADDWVMRHVADLASDSSTHDVLVLRASSMGQPGLGLQQWQISAYLHALRGCAAFLPVAPAVEVSGLWVTNDERVAWKLFAPVLLSLYAPLTTDEAVSTIGDAWRYLTRNVPAGIVTMLIAIRGAAMLDAHGSTPPHTLLLDLYPEEMRTVLEWALQHRDRLATTPGRRDRDAYIVTTLGVVGSRATADILRRYVHDPDLGALAVAAVRRLENTPVLT